MKLAIFSDLHVHAWQEHSRNVGGTPSRLAHCVSVLERIREYMLANCITDALFGGDLFHKRGVLYTQPYNLVVHELALWKEHGLGLKANVGNHDLADQVGRVHALQALQSAGLLQTVGDDGWANWTWHEKNWKDVSVTAVAYCPSAAELRRRTDAALADLAKFDGFRIGLFHHGFKGARVGTSLEYVVKEDANGDKYAAEFSVMLSGHYHAHQEIGKSDSAWYVGSPMEFVRGEVSPKGFLVLDTDAAEIERVDLDLPRFIVLHDYDIADDDFDVRAHVRGNFVDVVFEELPTSWDKLEETLRRAGAEGVRACPLRSDKLPKSSRLQVDPTMGDRKLLESYLEYVKVDPSERDDLLKIGLELLNQAEK